VVFAAIAPPQGAPLPKRSRRRFHPNRPIIEERHVMANTRSAKKAVRQTARRTEVNKSRRTRARSSVRKVEEAIAAGDKAAATAALREAEPELMRSAQKGILHKNTAARKVSRLVGRVKRMGA
jgi:small subunit ribosomal protein S20